MYTIFMLSRVRSILLENKTTKQTVAKNTFWLFFGNILARFIRAGIIIYAARILVPQSWGAFNYALSIAGFFTIFADLGINSVITRESARNLSVQDKYFSTAFFIKIVLSIIAVIALLILYPTIGPLITSSISDLSLVSALIPFAAIIVMTDTLRDFAASLSRAWEKMEIESFVQIFTNVVIVVAGYVALRLVPNARSLALGYAIGTTVGMIVAFFPYRRYFKNFLTKFSTELIKPMFASSWPLAMVGLMGSIMLNTDSIIIGWLKNMESVGFYSAGLKITQLVYIIPTLIAAATFPQMAKSFNNKERSARLLGRTVNALLIFAIPLTVGGVLLAKQIIFAMYGSQYAPGVVAFMLMNLTYIAVFTAAPMGNAIFAMNQERRLFSYVVLGIFGNLLFDIIFIPIWGIAGSALSTVINQIISAAFIIHLVRPHVPFKIDIKNILKITISSFLMGVLIYLFIFLNVNLFVNLIASTILYLVLLAVVFREKELAETIVWLKNSSASPKITV
jgi:O-antigen/teichoic acid export membrane protein